LRDAIKEYFNIPDGYILNLGGKRKEKIAKNIYLTSTGNKKTPNICIIDKGEGQHPEKFKDTFLSLNKSNKLRIPFVQGKNNMGSTGVFEFCGSKGLQLIISRRNPEIENGNWGYTLIRKFPPSGNMKHSAYKYLTPNGEIPSFNASSLPLLPLVIDGEWKVLKDKMTGGTFIKMYEYHLSSGHRSDIRTNLHYRLATYLPDLGLPVTMIETRYKRRDASSILYGFYAKLRDEKEKIEGGFPISFSLQVKKQKLHGTIHVFKQGQKKEMYDRAAIIFSDNGQSQGFITKRFFTRKSIKLSYLKDDLVVVIDCTQMTQDGREALFMNSRDRLRDGDFKSEIESQLEATLSENDLLKKLNHQRKRRDIEKAVTDSSNLEEVLQKVLDSYPDLGKILQQGKRVSGGIKLDREEVIKIPDLKEFPTYFKLRKKKKFISKVGNKLIKIKLETDAVSDYLSRSKNPGKFDLEIVSLNNDPIPISPKAEHSISVSNGIADLVVSLPKEEGSIGYKFQVTDIKNINGFSDEFVVEIKQKNLKGPSDTHQKSKFELPKIVQVERIDWKKYNFNVSSAAILKGTKEEGYVVYVNVHNASLLSALAKNSNKSLTDMYSSIMTIFSLLLVNTQMEKMKDEFNYEDAYSLIETVTASITPGLFPLLLEPSNLE